MALLCVVSVIVPIGLRAITTTTLRFNERINARTAPRFSNRISYTIPAVRLPSARKDIFITIRDFRSSMGQRIPFLSHFKFESVSHL